MASKLVAALQSVLLLCKAGGVKAASNAPVPADTATLPLHTSCAEIRFS